MTNAPVDPRLVEFVRQRRQKATAQPVNPKLVDFVRQRRAAMKPQTPIEQPGLGTVAKAGLASGIAGAVTGAARLGQSAASFLGAVPRYLDTAQAAVVGRGVQAVEDPIGTAFGVANVNPDVAAVIESNVTAPDRASEVAARQIAKPMRLAGDIGSSVERGITSAAGPKAQVPYSKEWFSFNAGQMVPQIAASIGLTTAGTVAGGPGVGLAAGFGSTFAMEGGDQAKSIYDAEIAKGADAESAAVAAFMPSVATGLLNAGIEQAGLESLIRSGKLARGIKGALEVGTAGLSEGLQEGAQGNVQRMYGDTAYNPASAENLSQTGQEMTLGATMGLGSAVPGGIAAATTREGEVPPARVTPPVAPPTQTKGEPASQLTPPNPPAPFVSQAAQAAADRLRGAVETQSQLTAQTAQPPAADNTGQSRTGPDKTGQGPLIPPGQQPSEQDLADARAIIMRDPQIVTQPSRFRAEYLAARKRRAQPARPFAYTDNPDLATVLGADQIGLTNIRTQRGDSNAAQRAESGGGTPGAVAVRGPDVPAAPAPAVQDRAVSPSDQGRGVEGAPDVAAAPSPVGDGVGEVVGEAGAQAGDQPGDVGVKQPWEMTRGEYEKNYTPKPGPELRVRRDDGSLESLSYEEARDRKLITPKQYERRFGGLTEQASRTMNAGASHRAAVARALSEGKPVPAEVLAEYPDLAAKVEPDLTDDGDPDAILSQIKAELAKGAGRESPAMIRLYQELGTALVPGVRLQDAESVGRTYDMLDKNTVTLAEYAAFVQDLRDSGKVRKPEASSNKDAGKTATSPTAAPNPAPAQKQPWEMTAQAYSDYEAGVMGESAKPVTDRFKSWHRSKVILATREGKPVPAEVLAEYPDLAPKTEADKPVGGFDSEKWNQDREARIKASKEAGNVHLDDRPLYVGDGPGSARGREIYNVHDPKERGTIRTVANTGDVVVYWSDKYSGDKNLATVKTEKQGRKTTSVLESWLAPTDLKDYVFAGGTTDPDPATLPAGPTGVEKYGIYSVRVRDRGTMYAVRTSERADGFGDSMFESVAEAKDYANDQRERDTANAEFRSREAAENERKEAAKAQRDAERSDTDGFADSLDPMRRGKVIASLAALVNIDGVVQSARDHVRAMVKSGSVELSTREVDKIKPMSRAAFNRADNRQQEAHERRVKEGGKITEYRINGYNLGKTAYEYAQHLVNRQSESQHPDPATLPRPQLVRLAKERGVDTKGTKKEIAERLKAQTAPSPEQQTTTPAPATDAEKVIDRSTKIREHLNTAISKRKSPAIWVDHQLILEDGKYDVDENGKRTKTQDLSGAGFLKNAEEIYDSVVNDGVQYAGMNEAAKELVARVRAKRDVRQQAEESERAKEQEQSRKNAASEGDIRTLLDNATSAAKFKTEDVAVKFGEETKTIAMKVYKGLGIWKVSESGWYNVTHIKTGKRFDQYRTLGEAKVAVVRMSLLADFTQDEAGILKQFDAGEYRNEIKPLASSVYAVSPRLVAMVEGGNTTSIDATTPRTKVVAEARKKGVPAETLKKSKAEIVEAIKAQEPTNEPAAEAVEPAPADVAQGSEPAAAEDRYGIRDAAAAFVATTKAKYDQIVKELEEARKQRAEASARGDYSDEAWVKFQKLEAQQQNWSGKLKNAQQIGDDANAMADALANNSPTDPTSAGAIYDAYRRAARGSIDFTTSLPRAAMDAIDTAIRTLLVPSGVDAGTDTTLYVWRDEYDTGIEDATKADRIKAAKDLAAKMVKEDKAARAELQRIAERGVMVTDAGKIVARPEAKPTVMREPKVTPFKTVADRIKGITAAAARETSRYAINGVLVAKNGTQLVTTDGRRLWMHDRKQGFGVSDGLMAHDGKGGLKAYPADTDGNKPNFPPYDDVIPRHKPEDNLGDHDPVKLANMLRRSAIMTNEDSRGVLITRNAEGQLGVVAQTTDVGEAHIGPRGTEALFAVNPEFMAEALEWHAKNGAETVKIENAAPNKPIVITGFSLKDGDKTTSVTMPVSYTSDSDGSSRSREGLSTTAASRGVIDKPTIDAKLDAIADAAKERLATRAKKQAKNKTLNAGLNPEQLGTALRDTVDLSIVGAAKAAAAGVRAGRALTKIVDAAIAEMGRTVTPKVRAIIQKNVRKILAESGGDPDKFEKVVSDLYNAPVTKKDIRAQAKARKQAAASITNPGENAAPVSQADALRGRLKAAEQTGEKVAKSAAAKIVQATRQGYQRGRRDERRTAIANMQGVVNDIKRERGRLRSLAQFEKRAGEVAVKMTADDARRAKMIRDGIRKQVVQYARTLPNEVRGRLVGRIATADTPVKMIKTVRALQRELMRHDGREAWGWIKKNARSTAVDKLKVVTNDLRKSVADLYAKAASAKRRIDAAETLKDSSIALAELQNLQAEIGLHITTARAAFKAIKGQRQQSAFQIATNAADIIAKRFAKRSGDGVSQIRDPKRWWIRKHLDSYSDLRNMLATLEGDNGPLFSAIWEALEEGSAEYSSLRRDMRAEMERSYIRAGFKSMADAIDSLSAFAGRGVEKKYTVTVGGESKTLSLGEISSLIAHNSDPETAALIASEFGMRFTSPEGTGNEGVIPTPNEIKAMAAAIEKDYKLVQLVDDFKAILEKRAPQTLRTVGEITGIEPRRVEKRWTRSRDMEMVPGMEDKPVTTVDPSMVNVIRSFAENMGIYEHRTQTTGIPILLKDVHSVMEEEIHKQAATLALARRVRDAMLVLTQDQLGKAIINAKGVEFYRSLKRQVMAAGRTEVVYATQAEKAVGFLKGSAAVKYLAANPSTYIGNLLGTLRVLPDVDARYYAAGIAAMWSMSRAELEAKSGYLWDRWEQQGMGRFGPSHEATMDARLTQAHTGFRSFLREIGRQVRNSMKNAGRLDLGAGLTNLRLGSAAFMQGLNWVESRIAAFTWGAMDAKIRSEQPNLSDKARQKIVEKFVRREMRETQNGGDPVDAATIATQNRSSAASMVMFLLSDVMKVRNRVKRAFRQSKTYGSKVLAAEAVGALAKAYAVKYLWDSIAFGIAGALGDDDDKERITERMKEWTSPIERAAQELFQIVAPIGGPDLASLIDALRGRYSDRARGGPVAMLAPLNDARAAGWDAFSVIAKSIENDDMNAEKIGLALAKFFDETASAFGLNPLSPWTRRVLREIVQTRKSEWW